MTEKETERIECRRDDTQMKVDIGVLKNQILTITELCHKMDTVIDKLMAIQEKNILKIYDDLEVHRDKISSELDDLSMGQAKAAESIRKLEQCITSKMDTAAAVIDAKFLKLDKMKWMVFGGILVLSWLFSHINFDIIFKLLGTH